MQADEYVYCKLHRVSAYEVPGGIAFVEYPDDSDELIGYEYFSSRDWKPDAVAARFVDIVCGRHACYYHGNVIEWNRERWAKDYHKARYLTSEEENAYLQFSKGWPESYCAEPDYHDAKYQFGQDFLKALAGDWV